MPWVAEEKQIKEEQKKKNKKLDSASAKKSNTTTQGKLFGFLGKTNPADGK
jgi:hypothetical protein